MANPMFTPETSTNQIYRDQDDTRCLTDDLDAIEADIEDLQAEKADADHSHSGYAETIHTHSEYAPTGHSHNEYAEVGHAHNYAPTAHTHTASEVGAAASAHTHAQSEVTGLVDTLTTKADTVVFASNASISTYKRIYLAPTGDDTNNGLNTSSPMKTVKGAVRKYLEKYKMLDLALADGTYTEDIGSISLDMCNLAIRSQSENKDAVTINMATTLEPNLNQLRLYNLTLNVTKTNVRAISVTAGNLYAYNVRAQVPETSDASCVNVYNGSSAFLMNCVLNAGTATTAGAAAYGNQAMMIKAINCSSERKVNIGVHAHNGTDIIYTDTINATTKAKTTSWGKCTVR